MRLLLPRFLERVRARFETDPSPLVDLGCGTGRNTIQLLDALSAQNNNNGFASTVFGVDASPKMLDVARSAIDASIAAKTGQQTQPTEISLAIFDLLNSATSILQLAFSVRNGGAVGVISTLVLEHTPAKVFSEAASSIMKPGAYLLVTNMHAEMGMRSQAGFTDPATGVKIRPTSYCHSIPEVLSAADEAGFQVENLVGQDDDAAVLVRDVDERLGDLFGVRAKKWVGVKVWFGVCFSKRQ
jgi:SAM-dependent methyltransferase